MQKHSNYMKFIWTWLLKPEKPEKQDDQARKFYWISDPFQNVKCKIFSILWLESSNGKCTWNLLPQTLMKW